MRRRRRKKLPQEPVLLEIENLSHEGRGIAHIDGKVAFVDGALPGEKVSARYTESRRAFDQLQCLEVFEASKDRVIPPCEYASICGGCSLQHFDSKKQLLFKEEILHEKLLLSLGHSEYESFEALKGPTQGYRRKARLAVRYVHKKEKVLVGFREKSSAFITNMESCKVLDIKISNLLPYLSSLIGSLSVYRDIAQIEVAVGDDNPETNSYALVFRNLKPLPAEDLDKLLIFAEQHQFDLYLQSGGLDSVLKVSPEGSVDRLYYLLPEYNLKMGFHPMDFTQVNAEINRNMIQLALALLDLDMKDKVLDLFCGLGNFSLPLATKVKEVVGIEGSELMVQRGHENAKLNGLDNVAFFASDLTKSISDKAWNTKDFTKVLLDPPRSGSLEILSDICKMAPQKIVYVSCNPATLARDAGELQKLGYKLHSCGVMDMFPHTSHVESIALFVPAGAK